jgi:hypothetical protein
MKLRPEDIAVGIGGLMATVGVIDGIAMIAQHHQIDCPAGTIMPVGADLTCTTHPLGFQGTAVLALSVMLAVVIYLAARIAAARTRSVQAGQADERLDAARA